MIGIALFSSVSVFANDFTMLNLPVECKLKRASRVEYIQIGQKDSYNTYALILNQDRKVMTASILAEPYDRLSPNKEYSVFSTGYSEPIEGLENLPRFRRLSIGYYYADQHIYSISVVTDYRNRQEYYSSNIKGCEVISDEDIQKTINDALKERNPQIPMQPSVPVKEPQDEEVEPVKTPVKKTVTCSENTSGPFINTTKNKVADMYYLLKATLFTWGSSKKKIKKEAIQFAEQWITEYACEDFEKYDQDITNINHFASTEIGLSADEAAAYAIDNVDSFCSDINIDETLDKETERLQTSGMGYVKARNQARAFVEKEAFVCDNF